MLRSINMRLHVYAARIRKLSLKYSSSKLSANLPVAFTAKIWITLLIAIAVYYISATVSRSSKGKLRQRLHASHVERLQLTAEGSFPFCPKIPSSRTIVHSGSNARIDHTLKKAMRGEPVTISVLGSSVAACHGAGDDTLSETCFPHMIFDWWDSIFPHFENELTNGAMRTSGVDYFAFCSANHLPDKTDIIVLAFDQDSVSSEEYPIFYEELVSTLLNRDDRPAVISLSYFAPQLQAQNGFASHKDSAQAIISQFHDVPLLSLKGLLYDRYMSNPEVIRKQFFVDALLAGPQGHESMASIFQEYIKWRLCDLNVTLTLQKEDPVTLLMRQLPSQMFGKYKNGDRQSESDLDKQLNYKPPGRVHSRPETIIPDSLARPFCSSANDLINPIPSSMLSGTGWATMKVMREDREKASWFAREAGSKLRLAIKASKGDVFIHFLRCLGHSEVMCWVDDNRSGGKVLTSTLADNEGVDCLPSLVQIDRNVVTGTHYVECEVQLSSNSFQHPFHILGIYAN